MPCDLGRCFGPPREPRHAISSSTLEDLDATDRSSSEQTADGGRDYLIWSGPIPPTSAPDPNDRCGAHQQRDRGRPRTRSQQLRRRRPAGADPIQSPHLPEEASLEILDDGHGMSQDVLLGPWLEPATDFKASGGSRPMGASVHHAAGGGLAQGRRSFCRSAVGPSSHGPDLHGQAHRLEAEFDWNRLDVEIDTWISSPSRGARFARVQDAGWNFPPDRFPSRPLDTRALRSPAAGALAPPRPRLGANPFAIELAIDGRSSRSGRRSTNFPRCTRSGVKSSR